MAPAPNSRLTPKTHKILVEAIRRGNYRDQAASLAGISRKTLLRWLQEGRREEEQDVPDKEARYRAFYLDVVRAEAEFEDEMIVTITNSAKANPQNWAAAMTILERKYPQRYGRRDALQIEGGDKPLVNINVLGNPEVRELATGLLEALAGKKPMEELGAGEVIGEDG